VKRRLWVFLLNILSMGACAPSHAGGDAPQPAPDAECRVLELLARQCWSCHGTTLRGTAPNRLVTREQLRAPSAFYPAQTEAERVLARMVSAYNPMPPGRTMRSNEEDLTLLRSWIHAGYPESDCAVADPFEAPGLCTGEQLPPNQQEGERMNPGRSCTACHEQINAEQGGDAPIFRFSGTVFPSPHAPDDCLTRTAKGAQIEVTDALGEVVVVEANEAGNFFSEDDHLVFPYTARVIDQGRERVMVSPQTNGACNECHSAAGTSDAPGRILLP
jgi:hypothetical protein